MIKQAVLHDLRNEADSSFKIGQKVRFGSRWHQITGEIIAWGTRDAQGQPRLCVRYYDDPNHFGHPYPIEVEVPVRRVQLVA